MNRKHWFVQYVITWSSVQFGGNYQGDSKRVIFFGSLPELLTALDENEHCMLRHPVRDYQLKILLKEEISEDDFNEFNSSGCYNLNENAEKTKIENSDRKKRWAVSLKKEKEEWERQAKNINKRPPMSEGFFDWLFF